VVRIEDGILIDRPVEKVWKFVSDPSNNPKWFQGTCEIRPTSEGPMAVGTTFEARIQVGGISQAIGARCTVLNQNQEITWELTSGATKRSTDTWRMEAMDDKATRLTRVFDLRVSGLWRLIEPIVVRGTKRAHAAEIINVKRILEGETPA
jgi:carbon monoxide dehydrogenase subunit G